MIVESSHIWQQSNMAISISPHGNDVQGSTIPRRMHEVFVLVNFQERSCVAQMPASDVLEIREDSIWQVGRPEPEHEKKR
jgi:hypothetical protein